MNADWNPEDNEINCWSSTKDLNDTEYCFSPLDSFSCSSSVFCTYVAVPCCPPHHTGNLLMGPLLCSWCLPVIAYLHHFSLLCTSLQLSGKEIQFFTSSLDHTIFEFSLSLHCLTVTCWISSTVSFLFHDKYSHSNTGEFFFSIDNRRELGWNFVTFKKKLCVS